MKVVTAAEMNSLDEYATSVYKIPSLLLMENAARGLVDHLESAFSRVRGKQITIVAGQGNNGGDGLAAARHFRMRGASVAIYLFTPEEWVKGDAKVSLDIWRETHGTIYPEGTFTLNQLAAAIKSSDFVIDAMLGTGVSRPVSGRCAEIIGVINAFSRTIIAVDIPSGISADTGQSMGTAVKAHATMTMALPKRGHFMQDGLTHTGQLHVVDLGFPDALVNEADLKVTLIGPAHIKDLLPPREKGTHKGTMGHLLVIAGALGKQGAPLMTSLAALRSGAGLVTTALPKSIEQGFSLQNMELMTLPLPETETGSISIAAEKLIACAIAGKKAVAIGPGLSQDPDVRPLVLNIIKTVSIPMVIDADALNAVASDLPILKQKQAPLILTPHPGEMGRLTGRTAAAVQKDRFNVAAQFAAAWDVILVLKGPHTLVALPDGTLWVNTTGNPGMATAGIGDALTGIIAGCLAQGLLPAQAAIFGVYLHGRAGDLAAIEKGEAGLLTSDLIGKIPAAIIEYLKECK